VGAGDAATSSLMASLLAGYEPEQAALVANLAASITVQQIGTTGVATPEQIMARASQTQTA
jgi:sugar/nucleoside kinase (ribokinase family)